MVILIKLFLVFQDMKTYFKIIITSIVVNVLLNYIFMKTINPPAAGIAISTSLGSCIITILYFLAVKKRISNLHGISILKSLLKTLGLSIIAGAVTFFTFKLLEAGIRHSFVNQIMKITGAAGTGILCLIILAFLIKDEEAEKIYKLLKNKLENILKK